MFEISISDSERGRVNVEDLEKDIGKFLSILSFNESFSLNFISDDEIRELNKEYRNKDEATDVLTFRLDDDDSFPNPEGEEKDAGDIFISIDSVMRNAGQFNVDPSEELRRVTLHGLLHLMGYDHATNDFASEKMLIRQEEILKSLC